MPFFGTRQALAALSEEQRDLLQEKCIAGERPVAAWIKFLNEVDRFDRKTDDDRNTVQLLAGLGVLAGVVCVLLGAVKQVPAAFVLGAALGLAGIGLGVWSFLVARFDLPEKPRAFAREVLDKLAPLVPPGSPVRLELDLGLSARDGTHETQRGTGSLFFGDSRRTTDDQWVHPILGASAALADGNRLIVRALTRIQRTVIEEMRRRGIGPSYGSSRRRRVVDRETRFQTESEIELTLQSPPGRSSARPGKGSTSMGDFWAVEAANNGTSVTVRRNSYDQGIRMPSMDDWDAVMSEARRRLAGGV